MNTRTSGMRGCFPHLPKYQDFWSINSCHKNFTVFFAAPLDMLKFESCCSIGDLNFPIEQ